MDTPRTLVALLCLGSTHLLAQSTPTAIEDELNALLNTPVTVASQKAMTTRESPGIVSLVTREDILSSGARDLIDVLRLVPGFDFGSDVQGVVGPIVRGNWAFEGKLLLLVDGQEINETRYGTIAFGNHFPVEQIRQIEIIRGPGSAIYGGFAELAVVNVITRSGADLQGASGGVSLGKTADNYSQRLFNAAYGLSRDGLDFSLSASAGDGYRSSVTWTDLNDNTRSLKDESRLRQGFFNAGLSAGGFRLRVIRDQYEVRDWTFYKPFAPTPMRFEGTYAEAKYEWKPSADWTFTPRISYKTQKPWYYPEDPGGAVRQTDRSLIGFTSAWQANPKLSLLGGVDIWKDRGHEHNSWLMSNGQSAITYNSYAAFVQMQMQTALGNITAGGRYDHNSAFGSSFVPRVAFTKVWDLYHFKVLASRAFRAPVLENIELNRTIKAEKTTALEMEFGAQLSSRSFVSVNVFDLSIRNPIVYYWDADLGDQYLNYSKTGTRGLELDYMLRGDWGALRNTLTLTRAKDNQVPDYAVPGEKNYMLAAANVKYTLAANIRLTPELSLNPSLVAIGPRFAYEAHGGPNRYDATALVNVMIQYRRGGSPFYLSGGVHNLTGANVGFIKGYQGTDGDRYPSQGTDVFVRIGYRY